MTRYYIGTGERFQVDVVSSTVVGLKLTARYLTKAGHIRSVESAIFTTVATRTTEQFFSNQALEDGEIVSINVNVLSGTVGKRGQTWLTVTGTSDNCVFARGYIYNLKPLSLGENAEMGPGGGEGFLSWVALFQDRAGNAAAANFVLAATNAFRRVHRIVHYYNATATVATRTFARGQINSPGGTLPTGFADANATMWSAIGQGNLTLTASEEGTHYADARGMTSNDSAVITKASQASDWSPFPLDVIASDPVQYTTVAVTNGEALDTQSAYAYIEEWLVL